MAASALQDTIEELSAIEAELSKRRARSNNLDFTLYTFPGYEVNAHHRIVAKELDDVLAGKTRRLILLEPPQNGKTEQVSRRFPAIALGKNPNTKIVACSYNAGAAHDNSRDVQKIIASPEYQALFPGTRLATSRDLEKRTEEKFEVVGKRGFYIGTGIDGTVTGKTADIGIIDDPVKNREEAESEVYRERVWNFYKTAFLTRQFGDKGAIVICLTRWHEDDLVGRLLKLAAENPEADQWRVVKLPALITKDNVDTKFAGDKRQIGEPLWPTKYPVEELAKRRAASGAYDWSALYQQEPKPASGGLVKREWFANKFVDHGPTLARRVRGWDTAGTEDDGDWTVGVRVAEEFESVSLPNLGGKELRSTNRFFIEDVQRAQLGPNGVDMLIKATAELDGLACAQREEKEGGASGVAVIEARRKALRQFDYEGVQISGSKIVRSKPLRKAMEAGEVYLVRAPWNGPYLDSLVDFGPGARHDDDMDATSTAYNSVLLEPAPEAVTYTW